MLYIFPVHRQKEKSQNLSLNCLISNLWKTWMMKHSARPYVFRFGFRFSFFFIFLFFFFNLNFFDSHLKLSKAIKLFDNCSETQSHSREENNDDSKISGI